MLGERQDRLRPISARCGFPRLRLNRIHRAPLAHADAGDVYCLARSDEFRAVAIKSMSGATGRQRVQEQCFNDFQIAQPPRTLLDRFSDIVAPGFRLIHKLHLQIQNLQRTRDLLLPRLLSGEVTLSDLEPNLKP